jgi:pimeloyl-[acyl-carrier protein] methyl ester esterase
MRLHAETCGAGPEITLLHGWAMHGGVWRDIAGRLASRYRVTRIDLPGHGRSPDARGPMSLDDLAECVAEALPGRGVVAGWSLGGLVALTLALRAPESVARLALIGGTPQFVSGPDWPHGLDGAVFDDFAARLRSDPQSTIQRFLALQVRGSTDERRTLALLKSALAQAPAPRSQALDDGLGILRETSLRKALASIDVPVILIHGTRDTLAPYPAAVETANRLPRARLHPIDGAGHAPFMSHAAAFVNCLEDLPDAD